MKTLYNKGCGGVLIDHEDEILPDNSKISYCKQCKDCSMWGNGDAFSNKYTKGCCDMYQYPASKPPEVINNTGDCPYKVKR